MNKCGLKGIFYFDAYSYSRDLVSIYSILLLVRIKTWHGRQSYLTTDYIIQLHIYDNFPELIRSGSFLKSFMYIELEIENKSG